MKAETRLEQHRHAITVWDGREIAANQKTTVEACEAFDLAREAIALLRESQRWFAAHSAFCATQEQQPYPDAPIKPCTCGVRDYEDRRDNLLDGEEP